VIHQARWAQASYLLNLALFAESRCVYTDRQLYLLTAWHTHHATEKAKAKAKVKVKAGMEQEWKRPPGRTRATWLRTEQLTTVIAVTAQRSDQNRITWSRIVNAATLRQDALH